MEVQTEEKISWSPHQEAIFDHVRHGTGSATVKAVAGSGKSTTVKAASRLLPRGTRGVYLAFNRSVANDPKTRAGLAECVKPSTFHGACWWSLRRALAGALRSKEPKVDGDKVKKIITGMLSEEDARLLGPAAAKLVGLAKQAGLGHLVADEESWWYRTMDHFDVWIDANGEANERDLEAEAIGVARRAFARSRETIDVVDFDDMLYMALVRNVRLFRNDVVFIDEAQDTNAVQRALLRRMLTPGGRLYAVGDPAQAIYGFRGADSGSMAAIAQDFGCVELPLTVSYRCPRAVVELAQTLVPYIEAAPGAREGTVGSAQMGDAWIKSLASTDAVLCRQTAPLLDVAFGLVRRGVGCRVMGRDIGEGLVNLIVRMKARDIDRLEEKLQRWAARETEKARARGNEGKATVVEDRHACVRAAIEYLPENDRTVSGLVNSIERMFSDNTGRGLITLCTAHKAKGGEWDRVHIIRPELMMSTRSRHEWVKEQERNLAYVAYTRAMQELTFVHGETR